MQLIFKTEKLIKKLNSPKEFYQINKNSNLLEIIKKPKNKKGRPVSINLPKEIIISPEATGLIVGEGFIRDRSFVFANSNEKAIGIILEFLKQFHLPIKFYLEIAVKGKSKEFIQECRGFWEKRLSIKLNRVRLRKEFYNSGNKGTIHITINSSVVAKLLKQIIEISKKSIEKDKPLSISYLKGIIAAEGNVNIKKSTNCIYMIRISASRPEEREHYKRCLEKVGINIYCKDMPTISPEEGIRKGWKTTKGRAGAVIISRWDNFIKIFELGLLELSREKQKRFINYFINNKFTKQFLDFEKFINKEFTMKQAQEFFNFSGRYLNRVLTLYRKGYVSRRKLNKTKFVYRLTENYLNLYDKLKTALNSPITQALP